MQVSEAVGATLAGLGADTVFGVVGSGNFHVTNALIANGATFVATRHECGAACAADAWARGTGRVGILSVHQGPGLTNALTGITEATKSRPPMPPLAPPAPAPEAAAQLARALTEAERPVFVAGRGARAARAALEELADACGALLAASAVAKGLFHGSPWDLGVSGGFASPLAAELITAADLVVGWGSSLNMWTMRHGRLIGPGARVAQVDDDSSAIGGHRPVDIGVHGDVACTAR